MEKLDGKKLSEEILKSLRKKISLSEVKPALAVILVGRNRASEIYVKIKSKCSEKVGIKLSVYRLSGNVSQSKIIRLIKSLNDNRKINGIIVQLPLPSKFNADKIVGEINPRKDADGFHPENVKKFFKGEETVTAAFPAAIMKLVERTKLKLAGKKAVIMANSQIFGKIMQMMLVRRKINSQVLLSAGFSKKKKLLKEADIIITAVGKPGLIKGTMVKKGAVIIDGGITKRKERVWGDVDFNSVAPFAGWLSPVPGGVGPVTVACLLENVYKLSLAQRRK